ncbi:uncharacterized protein LOC142180044 [Nicotiana tabacum]|uniref:Uncharacterized protein LOC142180044 n=1 Tax=Nicotiana tabacum TaxID=4097 RepID=A0AC58UC43_TOBAC
MRGHLRGGGQVGGAQPLCYAFPSRLEVELSDEVIADFEVILDMDWLSLYQVSLDSYVKTMTLTMLGFPRLEWRGALGHSTGRVVSYLKARRMVEKECLAYLVYIQDSSAEVSTIDLVPVVREFPEVFTVDFLVELKKLKELLQDLLDKRFRPTVSPWSAQVLFVKKKDESMRMFINYRKSNKVKYEH